MQQYSASPEQLVQKFIVHAAAVSDHHGNLARQFTRQMKKPTSEEPVIAIESPADFVVCLNEMLSVHEASASDWHHTIWHYNY